MKSSALMNFTTQIWSKISNGSVQDEAAFENETLKYRSDKEKFALLKSAHKVKSPCRTIAPVSHTVCRRSSSRSSSSYQQRKRDSRGSTQYGLVEVPRPRIIILATMVLASSLSSATEALLGLLETWQQK